MTRPMYTQTEPEAWREKIRSALRDFSTVSELAGDRTDIEYEDVEFLSAPHAPPTHLPTGKMAVYGFWIDDKCLKIGKAGSKSNQRYTYQHYNIKSANSTLAKSIMQDPSLSEHIEGLDKDVLREWIKRETSRVNILLPSTKSKHILSLLESFLHVRLHPKYEG